jgi:hypothetical protein
VSAAPTLPEFGLSEQQLREGLQEELIRSMRSEGGAPTIHAIAASIARVIERDHLLMAEQLQAAGIHLRGAEAASRHEPES